MTTKPKRQDLAKRLLQEVGGDVEEALKLLRESALAVHTKRYRPKNSEVIARATGVVKHYKTGRNQVQALAGVNLDIYKGEFVAITGSSGSGKSTLLQLLGGLDKPTSGTIEVAGQDLAKLRDGALSSFRNHTIGFVFQFFYLQPFLRLQTNIEVPAMFGSLKRQGRTKRSQNLAEKVGLSDRLRHLPRELSGGQMQRAAIARALLNEPTLLLADEPTGNLDSNNARSIFDLFRQICKTQGTTVIVVTHDRGLASLADRIVTMSDGVVV